MSRLIPIRIPAKWAVTYNSFYDDEMIVENGEIHNFLSFKEDVLLLEECKYSEEGKIVIDEDGYFLDLGWYPDSNPNGEYKLRLLRSNWDNTLLEYTSKSKEKVVQAIESCLETIVRNRLDEQMILVNSFKEI
jgi:hypothetical protein